MIRLTKHTAERMAERRIATVWIKAAIADPDRTARDIDPMLDHSFKAIPAFGHRILKVVHRRAGDDIVVVTAYFDRGAK